MELKPWYHIDFPSNLDSVITDHVSYTASGATYLNVPCYRDVRDELTKHKYHCYPTHGSGRLSANDYTWWMNLCKNNFLVPPEAEIFTQKGENHLKFDARKLTRAQTFATLCCYRWTDAIPRLPYLVPRLLNIKPQLEFFQVLQYAMALFVTNNNHNFAPISNLLYDRKLSLDVMTGVTMKIFYESGAKSDKHGHDNIKPEGTMSVYAYHDLLDEKWLPLYKATTKEERVKLLQKMQKNGGR